MTREERLKRWASELTEAQAKEALVTLTEFAIDSEWVSFWDDSKYPYYSNCGEPVVES